MTIGQEIITVNSWVEHTIPWRSSATWSEIQVTWCCTPCHVDGESTVLYDVDVSKMWMFGDQFQLSKHERRGLHDICNLVISMYTRLWFTAPSSVSAPRNDLIFMQRLVKYQQINPMLYKTVCQKFLGQLWYLREEWSNICCRLLIITEVKYLLF